MHFTLELTTVLGPGQNHHAVAGGYAVGSIRKTLRGTHPLSRGGTDPVQVSP